MSIRKVVTKTGQVKYEVRLHKDGRGSKRLCQRFDRKTEAEEIHSRLQSQHRESRKSILAVRGFDETTFEEEARFWLLRKEHRFSPGHLKRVKGIFEEILPQLGHLTPDRVGLDTISDFQSEQLDLGKKPATVNRKTEVIAAVLNFSVKNRRIPFSPCHGYEKLTSSREGVSFWEIHEAEKFLAFAQEKYPTGSPLRWVYVVYLDAINTAKRAGEIWGLKPSDLVQGGELQNVQRQYDRVAKTFRPLKWNMPPRHVPCNSELRAELFALIESQRIPKDRTIFAYPDNGRAICHEVFVDSFFDKDVTEAGVKRIRFHDLRHTGTTFLIAAGYDLKTVMEICGHKNLKTTMAYTHLLANSVRKVAQTHFISGRKAAEPVSDRQQSSGLQAISA